LKRERDPVEDDRMVVGDQDPDQPGRAGSAGRADPTGGHAGVQTWRVAPPSSLPARVTVPTTRPRRSDIDTRPRPVLAVRPPVMLLPPGRSPRRPAPSSETMTATPSRRAKTLTTT